jgi:hypothetical protein
VPLAVLFLGGVGGASDLDALLFHRADGAITPRAAHVETASGCHAERCLLVLHLSRSRSWPVIVGGLFSRLLISVPALYALVARPGDRLEV